MSKKSAKVSQSQLIEELSKKTGISKSNSQAFINRFIEFTLNTLNTKGKAAITNFGSFTIVEAKERTGVNPKTGKPLVIPAQKRISFTPFKALEKKVNKEFTHLQIELPDSKMKKNTHQDREKNNARNATDEIISEDTTKNKLSSSIYEEILLKDKTSTTRKQETLHEIDDSPSKDDIVEISRSNDLNAEKDVTATVDDSFIDGRSNLKEMGTKKPSHEGVEKDHIDNAGDNEPNYFQPLVESRLKKNNRIPIAFAVLIVAFFFSWFFFVRPNLSPSTITNEMENVLDEPTAFDNEQVLNNAVNNIQGFDVATETEVPPKIEQEVNASEHAVKKIKLDNKNIQTTANTYRISNGVWIYDIARKTYGNAKFWPLIFKENYAITTDPDLVYPNVSLNIPVLEGSTENPAISDYVHLAEAAFYVAKAYKNAGKDPQATAYFKAAKAYATKQ